MLQHSIYFLLICGIAWVIGGFLLLSALSSLRYGLEKLGMVQSAARELARVASTYQRQSSGLGSSSHSFPKRESPQRASKPEPLQAPLERPLREPIPPAPDTSHRGEIAGLQDQIAESRLVSEVEKQKIRSLSSRLHGAKLISLGKTTGACEFVELGLLMQDPSDRKLWHLFFAMSMVDNPMRVLSEQVNGLLRVQRWSIADSGLLVEVDQIEIMKADAFASRAGNLPLLDDCVKDCIIVADRH